MQTYIRAVSAASRFFGVASMGLMAAAVVVVCQMIFVRYVLNASTIWQTEFVIYAVVAATFLSSPYVLLLKGHVGVDLLPNAAGPRGRYWLDLFAGLASLAFCALLSGWRTETVWAIPLLPLPLGIGLLCLQYIAEMLRMHDPAEVPQ